MPTELKISNGKAVHKRGLATCQPRSSRREEQAEQHRGIELNWPLPSKVHRKSVPPTALPLPEVASHVPQPHDGDRVETPRQITTGCQSIDHEQQHLPNFPNWAAHDPPPSPPTSESDIHIVKTTGKQEDTISVPLAKLQQLVQLCADVLREREVSSQEADLEKGLKRSQLLPTTRVVSLAVRNPDTAFAWPGIGADDPQYQEVMEVWREVKPFQLTRVSVIAEDELSPGSEYSSYRITVDDLYSGNDGGPISKEDRASALAWKVMRYEAWHLEWSSILIVCCYSYGDDPNCSIGMVLERCYRNKVLAQPASLEFEDYLTHIQFVIKSFLILNFVFDCSGLLPAPERYPTAIIGEVFKERPEALLGARVTDLFKLLHVAHPDYRDLELDCAAGSTFRIDDLNINSLRSIGNLSIVWTDAVENHLKLDLNNMTLSVIWEPQYSDSTLMGKFQKSLVKSRDVNPATLRNGSDYLRPGRMVYTRPKSSSDENEIRRTWAILFATDPSQKKRLTAYSQLESPPWSSMGTPKFAETYQKLHLGTDKSIRGRNTRTDMEAVLRTALNKRPLQYSRFPIFELRLRQLRHYMDQQKPRGLRQLWHDKRDTLNYYTFWGVIIFGGLTIFLTLLGLAVGTAQTVAAFKALETSSPV